MSDLEERRRSILAALEAQVGSSTSSPAPADSGHVPDSVAVAARQERPARLRGQSRLASRLSAAVEGEPVSHVVLPQRTDTARPIPQIPNRRHLEMSALPQRGRNRSQGTLISFMLFVGLPFILAGLYYFAYASNQYVVEFRFAVREASTVTSPASTAGAIASQIGITTSSSSPENYMVADYLISRQIVEELQSKINVIALYSQPHVDWWARFDASQPKENFAKYWRYMTTSSFDQITGFTTTQVRAFSPDDAYLIAKTMVSLSEKLVNEIGMRPRVDTLKFAEQEVKRAEDRLKTNRVKLAEYREKEGVIDPTSNVVASNNTLAQTLRASLMQYQTELALLTKQNVRANAPPVQILQSRISSTRDQLAAVESQIGTPQDRSRSLSGVVGEYEQIDLERQFAQTHLTSALQTLEQARASALVQHLYITPFVQPSVPESSIYPHRFFDTLMVGFVCFLLWTIGLLAVRSIRDHLA